jgi:sec-independent protein translocase protein TatA
MGADSLWHWIIVIAVVLLLFGRGKVSDLMGDVARGIKSFKKSMADDEDSGTARPSSTPAATDNTPSKTPTSGSE